MSYCYGYIFCFIDTATTGISTYGHTLSLHDALPIFEGLARKAGRRGVTLVLTGMSQDVRKELLAHGIGPPRVAFEPSIEAAIRGLRQRPGLPQPSRARRGGT